MSKLFWLVSVLGVVAALAIWGFGTMGVRSEISTLAKEAGLRRNELRGWATDKKGEIVNPTFIREAGRYIEKLGEEEEALREIMRSRDMRLGNAAFGETPPPRDDVSRFRQWLTDRYAERNKLIEDANVAFPDDPSERGEVVRWEEVRTKDIPRILREYVVSIVVFEALAAAEAKLAYKGEKGELVEETRKVAELGLLSFGAGRRSPRGRRPRRERQAPAALRDAPHREHAFTVSFFAHYNLVADVIRRIEKSERGLFVVRGVRLKRLSEDERVTRAAGDEERRVRLANTPGHEAPVEVELKVSLFEFPPKQGGQS